MADGFAYVKLQLDPHDHERVAAFRTFCWEHVFDHASWDWIQLVRRGRIRFHRLSQPVPHETRYDIFDPTLDRLSYAFVKAYADRIWPRHEDGRGHLATVLEWQEGTTDLRATEKHLRPYDQDKQALQRRGMATDHQNCTMKSKIGRGVRAYFIELLESDQEVPRHQETSMWKLLRDFLNPSDPAPCDSVEAWQSANSNKKRKLAPITPPPHKRFCEQKASASPDSLASEDTLSTERNGEETPLSVKYTCWLPQCAAVFDSVSNMAMHVEKSHPVEYRSFLEPGIARALQAGTSQSKTNADTSELPMRNRNSTNTSATPFPETLSVADATLRPGEEGSTECTHNEHGKLWHADRGREDSYCQASWHCDGKVLNDGLCRCAKCDLGVCRSCWRKAYP